MGLSLFGIPSIWCVRHSGPYPFTSLCDQCRRFTLLKLSTAAAPFFTEVKTSIKLSRPEESRSWRHRQGSRVRVHTVQAGGKAEEVERILHEGTGRLVCEPRHCREALNSTGALMAKSQLSEPRQWCPHSLYTTATYHYLIIISSAGTKQLMSHCSCTCCWQDIISFSALTLLGRCVQGQLVRKTLTANFIIRLNFRFNTVLNQSLHWTPKSSFKPVLRLFTVLNQV